MKKIYPQADWVNTTHPYPSQEGNFSFFSKINHFILVLPLFLFLVSCEGTLESIEVPETEYNTEVETAKDVTTYYSDEGNVRVKVAAPVLLRFKDRKEPSTEFPQGLEVTFFSSTGKVSSNLTANYAIRKEKKGEVIIRDKVVVSTIKKETIETDELVWNEKEQKIVSDKLTKITTATEEIECMGFKANHDFSEYETGPLKGIKKIKKGEFGGKIEK